MWLPGIKCRCISRPGPLVRAGIYIFLGDSNKRRMQLTLTYLSVMLIWSAQSIVHPGNQVIAEETGRSGSVSQLQADKARIHRDASICGPHTLYLFMKLYAIPVEYEAIMKEYTPSHPEGMSLAELRDACANLGLPVRVRKCSVREMWKAFQSPVIAYVTGMDGSGHFMIILAVESDSAYLMDGTTARISRTTLFRDEAYKKGRLENVWRGYILVPSRGGGRFKLALGISVLLWLVAAYVILRIIPKTRRVI